MITIICLIVSVFSDLDEPPLPLLPRGAYLVRATVAEATNMPPAAPYYVRNKVVVQHVYGHAGEIKGRAFFANSADDSIRGNRTGLVIPRLRIGEAGIWLVKDAGDELRPVQLYNYFRWPARELQIPEWAALYEAIHAFAETVESISRLPRSDVVKALENRAADENPYISSWAISRLPEISQRSGDVVDFLNRLVDAAHVSIQGQVEVDRVQTALNGPRWQHSKARLKLFNRWLTGALPEHDARLVVSRLDEVAQHPDTIGFAQEDLLALTELLARNDRFPLNERQRARFVLMWSVRRYDSDQKPFETTADIVASDLPEELRRDVAWLFLKEFALNEERRETLSRLRETASGDSVKSILNKALAAPSKKGRP